jgi:hypothetical protein
VLMCLIFVQLILQNDPKNEMMDSWIVFEDQVCHLPKWILRLS